MIKAVLFDFWGTLVENGVWSPTKQVKEMLQIDLPFSEYIVRMERAMMTEKFPTLREAFDNVCQEFSLHPSEETLQKLVGMWNKSWMLAQPYPETAAVLETLKSNYRLILVSNSDSISVKNVLEKFHLNEYFERIFFSFEVGMIKTDKNFLKYVLDELGMGVDDVLMIGDSLQSDILPAQKIGMKAVLLDRKNSRPFQPKINNLQELNQLISTW